MGEQARRGVRACRPGRANQRGPSPLCTCCHGSELPTFCSAGESAGGKEMARERRASALQLARHRYLSKRRARTKRSVTVLSHVPPAERAQGGGGGADTSASLPRVGWAVSVGTVLLVAQALPRQRVMGGGEVSPTPRVLQAPRPRCRRRPPRRDEKPRKKPERAAGGGSSAHGPIFFLRFLLSDGSRGRAGALNDARPDAGSRAPAGSLPAGALPAGALPAGAFPAHLPA